MNSIHGKRLQRRGDSFTTCLLSLVILFGGVGFYYFTYFQWRHFEHPLDGLTYVDDSTAPQLNDFRKQAVSHVIDPLGGELKKLARIRKKTKKGTVKYDEFEQECTEYLNRLKEIMTEGRLRRIPTKFKKKYNKTLLALQQGYRSVNTLQDVFDAETDEARKKIYNESVKQANKAADLNKEARDYFHGSEWSE